MSSLPSLPSKGEKLANVPATVSDTGSASFANMGFETAYVEFSLSDGRIVRWHSDAAGRADLRKGQAVTLSAFAYVEPIAPARLAAMQRAFPGFTGYRPTLRRVSVAKL